MKNRSIFKIVLLFTALHITVSAQKQNDPQRLEDNSNVPIKIVSIDDTKGVIAGLIYSPKATFENVSQSTDTFLVRMEISNGYVCNREILLCKNAGVTVLFDEAILKAGMYTFTVKAFSKNEPDRPIELLSQKVTVSPDTLSSIR
jgi:hypothetical protein